jgi:Protein of unknown function (DUF1570)
MKWLRMLLAGAVLLGLTAASNADYVFIRYVIGGKKTDPNQPTFPGGLPGQTPPPGQPPRGGPGLPTPPPGAPRGGPGGDDGGPGGLPPLSGGQVMDIETAQFAVQGIVQVKQLPPFTNRWVQHRYTSHSNPKAHTTLYFDNQSLFSQLLPPFKTRHGQWESRKQSVLKNRSSERILEAADWLLAHGMLDEFEGFMDMWVKEGDAPTASKALKDAVTAYVKVKQQLAKPSEGESSTSFWRQRLQGFRLEQSPHYSVLYNSPVSGPPEVASRLKVLEEHMKGFYYWFALKGVALPMPGEKLVCVMVDQPGEFEKQRAIVEGEPLVSDGFYADRDNICVFSTQRIDPAYKVFSRQVQTIYTQGGYERQGLIDGTAKRRLPLTPGEFARYQTMALLDKLLEDEAERAAVSHEGSRQLMVTTGLVPRTVVPPHWAQFGTAAFFETPKGPFIDAPVASSIAFWPGWGAVSWAYVRPFHKYDLAHRDESRTADYIPPGEILKRVVTDGYFHRIVNFTDRPHIIEARATAWSLAYYLMRLRLPGMIRYFHELSVLPRDMEVDAKTLLACFARAFDVANATQDDVDPQKFEQLAKDWLSYMRGVTPPGAEFGLEVNAVGGDPNASPGGATPGQPPPGGTAPGGNRPGGRGPGGPGGKGSG